MWGIHRLNCLPLVRFCGIVLAMTSKQSIASLCVALIVSAAALMPPASGAQAKLKPEELIAKHLDSIGSAEKRNAVKSRVTSGVAQVAFRVGGSGTLNGKANILSSGNTVRLGFTFPALEYPGEQLAFDGNKVTAGQSSPGNYPPLSGFVYENDVLMKEGMLFGTLSTSWVLLDFAAKKPRLDSNGTKKIDGRELYELKYGSRNSKSNLQVWFYFEPGTFRHVRSVFKLEVPSTRGTSITDSAELVRYQIIERFEQFKEVDGFSLPHSHNIEFSIDGPRGGMLTTWAHQIEHIGHDEPVEKKLFSLQ